MIALLKTSERTGNDYHINNYVFQRHLFAYHWILKEGLANKQVLELGCGEGYGMQLLAPHAGFYLALDKKEPAHISFAKNAVFQQCRLPLLTGLANNQFHIVICLQVIEHIQNDHLLLREIKRVLKPGGVLLLTTPNKLASLTRNPFHIREYVPQQMNDLIAHHFTDYTVNGIYGNDLVLQYYTENKKAVQRITRFDIFNFQNRLPVPLLKGMYSLFNNLNRLMIATKAPDITRNIHHTDFFMGALSDHCLDYFVTARKEMAVKMVASGPCFS